MAAEVLGDSAESMTVDQIWKKAEERKLTERLGSTGKTPTLSLRARLYTELKKWGNKSTFRVVSRTPVTFGIRGKNYQPAVDSAVADSGADNGENTDATFDEREGARQVRCHPRTGSR